MAQNTNTVKIGDVEYPFKRVNLATFKKHLAFMQAGARMAREADEGKTPNAEAAFGQIMEMAEIVHECIARAKPEVTLDQLMEGLDQDSVAAAYAQVMTGSGYVPAGEPTAEAKA